MHGGAVDLVNGHDRGDPGGLSHPAHIRAQMVDLVQVAASEIEAAQRTLGHATQPIGECDAYSTVAGGVDELGEHAALTS